MYIVKFFWINDFDCIVNYFYVVIFFEFCEYMDNIFFGGFYDLCQVVLQNIDIVFVLFFVKEQDGICYLLLYGIVCQVEQLFFFGCDVVGQYFNYLGSYILVGIQQF